MPMEEAGGKPESKDQLQAAFEWAESHYKLAGQKYEEALRIKPDFYEVCFLERPLSCSIRYL